MKYISFDKSQLINLEYSLNKEVLRANAMGAFWTSTLLCCNTRKYHGLMICPLKEKNNENYLFLSSLDETVIQNEAEFHLGIHKFPNTYNPKGHKYVRNFEFSPISKITYRVGGVVLEKEILMIEHKMQVLIRYTLKEAHSPTTIQLQPFLAFRNIHKLSKANFYANTKYEDVSKGIKLKMYSDLPALHMQISKTNNFFSAPDWYYNFEYEEEKRRGYDFTEDLFVPGFFEFPIKKGETVVFSASLEEEIPKMFEADFTEEMKKIPPRNNYLNCLKFAANQFIVERDNKAEIIAGYPWFGRWGRDSFIALPGLTLTDNRADICKKVLDTLTSEMKDGLFPNIGANDDIALNSVDAPLWFFWAVKKYADYTEDYKAVWNQYGSKMKAVLTAYKNGTQYNISMHDNGLIYAGEEGHALTWMDAMVNDKAVTPRIGYVVEINALWYFALSFCVDLAEESEDEAFLEEWKDLLTLIKSSFIDVFWDDKRGYLADVVCGDVVDWSLRPNQVFAASLEYSMLTEEMKRAILSIVKNELLTPKGLRTLSPNNSMYKGKYKGTQEERDNAYHQGTVWPWLLGHYAEAVLRLDGKEAVPFVQEIFSGFEEDMMIAGISTISEVYDGNPPHKPRGAISQAWSVAELLRINDLIKTYKKSDKKKMQEEYER